MCQAVTDHRRRFTDYELGWPGSVHDSTVFKQSDIWMHRGAYFEDDEYLLVDKVSSGISITTSVADYFMRIGYPLTRYSIRPSTDQDLTNNTAEARRRKR